MKILVREYDHYTVAGTFVRLTTPRRLSRDCCSVPSGILYLVLSFLVSGFLFHCVNIYFHRLRAHRYLDQTNSHTTLLS